MPNDKNEFFNLLRNIDNKTKRIPTEDQEILSQFMRQLESLALADDTPELEQRGLPYLVVPKNHLLNPNFTDDLTSWTQVLDGGITATTARDTTQSKTLYASMASLKIDLTASSGTGDAKRTQTITAAAAEVWSFEAWVLLTALTNCKGFVKIEWLDSGSSVISTVTKEFTVVTSVFVLTLGDLEGLTAPGTTTQAKVSIGLEATSSGAVGTGYFDLIRAEKESSISDRATRIIAGEFTVS